MTFRPLHAFAMIVLVLAGLTGSFVHANEPEARPPVVLISIDGMRFDYLDRGVTPNLSSMALRGVRATAMRPRFPTKTFPNHLSIVTGLDPQDHGIVGNVMRDPRRPGATFTLASKESDEPFWWDNAEPVWITAERSGMPTATMFWPGSETEITGIRPSQWRPYNDQITAAQRVDQVLEWLDVDEAARPGFVALYFDDVDAASHDFGPDANETNEALAGLDRQIGRLALELEERGIEANLIVVSDHGMAEVSDSREIAVHDLLEQGSYDLVVSGAYAGIDPLPGHETTVTATLTAPHDHMRCWEKGKLPERLHYGANTRIPAIICLAETGWTIVGTNSGKPRGRGAHGFDNISPEMWAGFVAMGPAFKRGKRLGVIDNIDVYPLIMKLIGVPARETAGRVEVFDAALTDAGSD